MKGYVPFVTVTEIESENHFLLDCKAYSQIRDVFPPKEKLKYLTSNRFHTIL